MKNVLFFSSLLLLTFRLSAQCEWIQKTSYKGTGASAVAKFSVGNKGYIGTGLDAKGPKQDLWEYDPDGDTWAQKADFGGAPRFGASSFAIGSKGYIGTGMDSNEVSLKDFW